MNWKQMSDGGENMSNEQIQARSKVWENGSQGEVVPAISTLQTGNAFQ
jgi:hypothetical protein